MSLVHRHCSWTALGFLAGLLICGCQSIHPNDQGAARPDAPGQDGGGYSLLYTLLGDEKDVSKLLLIKRDRAELADVIKSISAATGQAHKQLESFAKADKSLTLKSDPLPSAERATREAISKTRAKQLLHDKGKNLELHLLLTQAEALAYGSHLAGVMAPSETNPERRQFLTNLSGQLSELERRVVGMIEEHYAFPEKSPAAVKP